MDSLFLKPHDTIEFIAPASKFDTKILLKITHLMQEWGLKAKISCPMNPSDWLCSTGEKERFDILQNALTDPHTQAIWVTWGGYGSAHLLPYLDQLVMPAIPKLLMGFSDTTILHLFLNGKWKWPSLHCPSAHQVALHKISKESISALKGVIFKNAKPYFLNIYPMNKYCSKELEGTFTELVGGNLSLIMSSLATPWQIQTQDKFLFVEEVGEAAYRIDRMFHQLLQAKIFDKVKGIIFGEFIQRQTQEIDEQIKKILEQWALKLPIPIFSCKAGHGTRNDPIPLQCKAQFCNFSKPQLKFF